MHKTLNVVLAGLCGLVIVSGCEKVAAGAAQKGVAEKAHVPELTDATFGAQPAKGVMLVDFWAPWCGPCRTQGPILEKAAAQIGPLARVFKVNVDQSPQLGRKYASQGIPSLVVFKDGQPVKRFLGVTPADELVNAVKAAQ